MKAFTAADERYAQILGGAAGAAQEDVLISSDPLCWYNVAMQGVNGVHHITAIAGPAQENLDFYAGVLGMRLVKRSVNQDDPEHLPSFLRRRRRASRIRSHVFPVGADGAAAARLRPRHGSRLEVPQGSLEYWGRAPRSDTARNLKPVANAVRPAGAARSPTRTVCMWPSWKRPPDVRSRRGTAARSRPSSRSAACTARSLGARRHGDDAIPDHRPRLRRARDRRRLDPLRVPRIRRRRRRPRRAGSAARRLGRR